MSGRVRRYGTAVVFLAAALALQARPAEAQRQRPDNGPAPRGPWPPIQVGARVGWDANSDGPALGLQAFAPVLPNGYVELLPSADVTFLNGTRDYQASLEAIFVTGGRAGGLYVGGGIGRRNGEFSALTLGRQTVTTSSLVLGVRSAPSPERPITSQIELRWVFVDELSQNPQVLTLGINVPLWGRGRPGSPGRP